ncbi:PAS domain S-box-containing protein/diguanylate cyclase (GGDEF) domain-containing protein [Devosia lucknowensis]|uniref:PAS domain S-box-containing protein/diguanylate cyclase (GGDEF) domain-containing protein n=1 Tax=Devosia lucknowensis TaxID=1096929 RepID=A0A1Y6G5G6_9HYPH|nr:diguanylate cyclase [Devosia lucknowensis]SMQ85296.1 PAS domain S-box-containing protein/diguanylate cyclase (GGDEF) domain-containing protein [Devosia lucknowensis]
MPDDLAMGTSSSAAQTSDAVRFGRTMQSISKVLDLAPVPMLLLERGGTVVFCNRAARALVGVSVDAAAPEELGSYFQSGDGLAVSLQCDRLWRGEASSFRGEQRVQHSDGAPIWVLLDAQLVEGEAGGEPCIILQLTDIELQKQAEAALIYSERRWNSALESARQGVWDYDMRRDHMYYSKMWRTMRHIPEDEEIGAKHDSEWYDRMHPDDVPRMREIARRQGQGEQGFDILEYREKTRQGDYVWILSRGGPIEWDEHGTVLRAVGTDTDITHIKTIELELAAEKERLRVTLESIADGMIAADATGHIEFMNRTAEQLTGVTAVEARGKPVRDVFRLRSERSGDVLDCPVWSCFEKQGVIRVDDDGILFGQDGEQRDVRCTAAPVMTADGVLAGAVLVFQDVTQSRALQRQLAHSAAHDELTGLPNRAAFERALTDAIAEARSGQRDHCLVYLDLDRFKPVNDSAGHAAGDELLRQVAQTIKGVCRSHDMAARIGGDEFAIILNGCPLTHGRDVAGKIVRAIAALVFTWAGRPYQISASAGVTAITSEPASPLGFLGEADAACYAAKARGRACVVTFAEMNGG